MFLLIDWLIIQPVIEHCDLTALTAATDGFIIFAQALKLTYLWRLINDEQVIKIDTILKPNVCDMFAQSLFSYNFLAINWLLRLFVKLVTNVIALYLMLITYY